ncbi:MAG: deaminase [Minisyncoccales bacterium]
MIIGITGTLGAGKGSVVEVLKKKGFKHYSVRDFLIEEIKKRGLSINRDNMVSVANQIRKINGPSYIVEKLYEKAQLDKYAIIESIRTIGEAEKIKELGGILIAVDANPEKRYSRILTRQSETDNISFEKFLEDEKREMFSANPHEQNLTQCKNLADYIINNDKTLDFLEKKVEEVIEKIMKKTQEDYLEKKESENIEQKLIKKRPSWDEYFMKMASLVAERSTCLRHNVGAIIVKDKKIIATGYNGAAKGITDCTERGCLRDELGIESGTRHEICRAIHAEQNAIIQCAYHGTSLKKGIMYCTHTPCMICAKMIANSGIKEIISYHDYSDKEAKDFLEEAGIKLKKVPKPSDKIHFKD